MSKEIVKDIDLEKLVRESDSKLGSSGYYRVQCPLDHCHGHSLSMSISKDFRYGYCFRCETTFLQTGNRRLEDIESLDFLEEINKKEEGFYSSISDSILRVIGNLLPPEGTEYFRARNPFVKDWSKLRINYEELEDGTLKILTPYFYDKFLVYYQIRYKFPDGSRRFKNPSKPTKIYIPYGIADFNKPSILCEGPYDAIALSCILQDKVNIYALGGSAVSNHLLEELRILGGMQEVLIMMDDTKKTNQVKYSIDKEFKIRSIPIYSKEIFEEGLDPEELLRELGKDELINRLRPYFIKLPMTLISL